MAYLNELDYLVAEDHPRLDYAENILETIGNTPLVRLSRVNDPAISALVLAKLEMFNPGGSIKDRVGLAMIEDAEQQGRLQPGGTIVESTSGNTGAGLALAAIQKGYQCVFVIPDKISHQKIAFLEALGARVVITPSSVPADDPRSCYNVAAQIVAETPNSCLANQYHNPANPQTHVDWTGPEIWRQTAGSIDVVVCGMGTGGTISGLGRYFKSKNPEIKVVGVDVRGSLLMESWQQGHQADPAHFRPYKTEGIGKDFVPGTLDLSVIDEVVQVDDQITFDMARRITREEGIFCGGSSGAAAAGLQRSEFVRALNEDQLAVVIFPDSGNRYMEKMYNDAWMIENGFLNP